MWITIIIVLFVVGSIMSLKPSGIEQRVDKVRMTARKLGLNPKLEACPEWLRGKDNEFGKGMMAKYGIVIDDYKMPHVRYTHIDGLWHPLAVKELNENGTNNNGQPLNLSLAKSPLELPSAIANLVTGLEAKANGIVIYWQDVDYVRPTINPNYDAKNIEDDLNCIKNKLNQWAMEIN